MRLGWFCVIVLVGIASTLKVRADTVDDFVRKQMGEGHLQGVAIAVVQNGKTVKLQGYGVASVEFNVAVTSSSVFELGSVTKQITAAAILLLVEESRVRLDDRISTYIPESPPIWKDVTVRHLLTHTSGIRNYSEVAGFELSKRMNRQAFVRELAQYPLDFQPGEKWSYSNSGYNLLGHIIAQASGKTYWDFLKAHVFGPLGMKTAGDRDLNYVVPNRVTGYEWDNGTLIGRDYELTDLFSAGAIVASITDLVQWNAALSSVGFLKAESMRELWKPVTLNSGKTHPYGFGWNIETIRGIRRLRHNGQTAGFAASIAHYPDQNLTVIALCNSGESGAAGVLTQGVAKQYLPELALRKATALADPDSARTKRLLTVTKALLEQSLPLSAFAEKARQALTQDRSFALFRRLAVYGPVKSFDLIGMDDFPARVLTYRAALGTHLAAIRFTLTDDGQIADLSVVEEE